MNLRATLCILSLLLLFAFKAPQTRNVLVIQQSYLHKIYSGDTVFVQSGEPARGYNINDSIRKQCGADTAYISTVFIANPGRLLNNLKFKDRFPRLQHLILAGNDADYLDSVRYDFFNCPTLKRITFSSVYMNDRPDGKKGYAYVRRFVHSFRPDIHVRFRSMGDYNHIGWPQ